MPGLNTLQLPGFCGRNDNSHPRVLRQTKHCARVIGFVRNKGTRFYALNKLACLSGVVPAVTSTLSGIPNASTAKCTFV